MPAMTVDEFFGEQIVNNLATFLGIPASKIKIANAVSEAGKRKKRDVEEVVDLSAEVHIRTKRNSNDTIELEIHISNEPSANKSATLDEPELSFDEMEGVTSALSDPSAVSVRRYFDIFPLTSLNIMFEESVWNYVSLTESLFKGLLSRILNFILFCFSHCPQLLVWRYCPWMWPQQ